MNQTIKEVFAGGRVRVKYQNRVREIASSVGKQREPSISYYGSMVSSSQSAGCEFLDGGFNETRGFFCDSSCGMFIFGKLATAFILYKLGFDAREMMKDPKLPSLLELEKQLGD
jgi:hypothetical protein